MAQHLIEMQKGEHASIGGVEGKKVFLFDDSGSQVTAFSRATVAIGGSVSLAAGANYIGLATVSQGTTPWMSLGTVTTANSQVTVSQGTTPWLSLGTVTVTNSQVTVSQGTVPWLSLATVSIGGTNTVKTGGTAKTIIPKTIAISASSIVTISVPTNTFYITNLLVNSNSTVRVNIKSGATYLTGNASIGVTIFPGGGWVENGSPESPLYDGLADAGAIVMEKWEDGGLVSKLSGHIMYFEE